MLAYLLCSVYNSFQGIAGFLHSGDVVILYAILCHIAGIHLELCKVERDTGYIGAVEDTYGILACVGGILDNETNILVGIAKLDDR